jgi:DNA polymerase-3 subunit gamma/tau
MSYLVFARKFRPQQLNEIIGQDHIVTTIKNAFLKERISQSYLFVGSRGVGKTSTARILAKVLNCQNKSALEVYQSCDKCASCKEIIEGVGFDVLEIDGASNRGIDEIRNLRDNVKFKPMHGKYKIYIIDEVHMLTAEAFNALLKTLEEPPTHVKFIFATTEPHKIPQTILSRCQRHDFKQITVDLMVKALRTIASKEKIEIDDQTLYITAKNAEGSLRDAESLLDKISNSLSGKITLEDAIHVLGLTATSVYYALIEKIIARDAEAALSLIKTEEEGGKDLIHFAKGLVEVMRDMLIKKVAKHPEKFLHIAQEDEARLGLLVHDVSMKEILYFFTVMQKAHSAIKHSPFPKIDIEAAVLKLVLREDIKELSEILAQLEALKKDGNVRAPLPKAAARPTTPIIKTEPEAKRPAPIEQTKNIVNEKPTQAQTTANAPEILAQIQSSWNDIVTAVKAKKMSSGTFLSFGKPVHVEVGQLTVAFSAAHKLNKETLDTEVNKKIVQEQIREITQLVVKVRYTINNVLVDEATRAEESAPSAEEDSIIKSALDIFQGRIEGQ